MDATGKKILVVDDEQDQVAYLTAYLTDQGFEVESAMNGEEAMAKVKKNRPDLITLDVVMPEKTGVKFYRDLKEDPAFADIPVIIITGLKPDFEKFISSRRQVPPPDGYISKPFDQQELVRLIKETIAKKSARSA